MLHMQSEMQGAVVACIVWPSSYAGFCCVRVLQVAPCHFIDRARVFVSRIPVSSSGSSSSVCLIMKLQAALKLRRSEGKLESHMATARPACVTLHIFDHARCCLAWDLSRSSTRWHASNSQCLPHCRHVELTSMHKPLGLQDTRGKQHAPNLLCSAYTIIAAHALWAPGAWRACAAVARRQHMFPAFLQCRTQRPPLLAWMLLTTRGKKFKPYKPEKTAEQVGAHAPFLVTCGNISR